MLKPSLFACALFCLGAFSSTATAEDETLRIFTLLNADCIETAEIIDVLSEGSLTVAADMRTNSLVVKGNTETLGVIDALLMKLDQLDDHERYTDRRRQEEEEEHEEHHDDDRHADEERLHRLERMRDEHAEREHHEREMHEREMHEREMHEREVREQQEIDAIRKQEEIEQEALRRREEQERGAEREEAERQIEFLKRRIEMAHAEAELEQAEMKAKIQASLKMLEAIRVRLELANSKNASTGGLREEIVMLEAELEEAKQANDLQKMRMEFHAKHAAPMRRMELEMEIGNKHALMRSLH